MKKLYISFLAIVFLSSCVSVVPAKVFQAPDVAYGELARAAKSGSKEELIEVFGEKGEELLNSGDEIADKASIQRFATALQEKHAWDSEKGSLTLLVGEKQWPFPIPLVEQDDGWAFDAEQGREEILDRKIGQNELGALHVCDGYIDAQYEYAEKDRGGDGVREYAQKFLSDPGKQNGLYWKSTKEQEHSPLGPGIAKVAREGYRPSDTGERLPYHGYYYKIIRRQGPAADDGAMSYVNKKGQMTEGFALVAYPARWGVSGVMTFIVNHEGEVFERDLGESTLEKAKR